MLNGMSRVQVVRAWIGVVLVLFACSVVGRAPTTVGALELWLVACLVPSAVLMFLWPAAPTVTVAGVLYGANTSSKSGRR